MSRRNLDLIPCTYIGLKGACTKPCFRGLCNRHKNRTALTLCKHCGKRGTNAPHGYCAGIEEGCRWKAQHASRVLKAERESWDAYLDEILSWDWENFSLADARCQEQGNGVPRAT